MIPSTPRHSTADAIGGKGCRGSASASSEPDPRYFSESPMHVLVLCEFASLNGGERSLLEVASRIARTEIQVSIAAPPTGPLAEALRQRALRHIPLNLFDSTGARLSPDEIREQIASVIANVQPDLVHANSVSMSRLSGRVVRQLGVASIGHLRDIMRLSRAAIDDLNRHSQLLAVSGATRRWYVECGVTASKVSIVYNGVDLERFRPRAPRGVLHTLLGIAPTSTLVANVGQLGMRKGIDIYVDAAWRIAKYRTDIHFLFVGQRYSQKREAVVFEQDVRRAAEQVPLRGRFHFLGLRDDIDNVLNELTLYVHTARQEPLGRVLLEAAASGCSIVATDVGGTSEIFAAARQAALLVPPGDVEAVERGINRLLEDASLRREMAQLARQCAAARFDAENASRQLAEWYRRIACRRHAS